jgi:acetyltransferase-like isoleucine patch superfamily enzyme
MKKNINIFKHFIREKILSVRSLYFSCKGSNVSSTARISMGARLDPLAPELITIGDFTQIAYGSMLLTHDFCRGIRSHVSIGDYCFIGVNVTILPGVTIGSNSIVGAGSLVNKDIPPNCIAVGNPCKVIKSNINTGPYGRLFVLNKE